jgi:Lipocalin-like domain
MKLFRTLTLTTMSLLLLAVALPAGDAVGQTAKELVGAWTLISLSVEQGGKKVEPFGANPNGFLMLDGNGHFSIMVVRPGLPKFASDNRVAGTAEENKAAVQGSLAYFGTLAGDQLTLANPTPSVAAGTTRLSGGGLSRRHVARAVPDWPLPGVEKNTASRPGAMVMGSDVLN